MAFAAFEIRNSLQQTSERGITATPFIRVSNI